MKAEPCLWKWKHMSCLLNESRILEPRFVYFQILLPMHEPEFWLLGNEQKRKQGSTPLGLLFLESCFHFTTKTLVLWNCGIMLVESKPNLEKYNKMLKYVANGTDGKSCQNIYNECMKINQ